jgi:vitamin B12 transporter
MIGISFNGIYKQRTKQNAAPPIATVRSDYFIVNGKLEALLLQNRLSLFVEADNIGDVSYTDLLGSKMPARWLMAGIKISLSK